MRSSVVFIILAVVFFVIGHFSQIEASARRVEAQNLEEYSVIPNKRVLPYLSLGYRTVLADLIWIRALQYNNLKNEANLVEHFADAIIHLDPEFEPVYKWASISTLFVNPMTKEAVETSNGYLRLAFRQFPKNADYPYSLGMNYTSYYPTESKEERKEAVAKGIYYLQQAMVLPTAPPNIPMLISGLLTDDDSAKKRFLEQALLLENDPDVRKRIQMRLVSLNQEYAPSLLLNARRDFWRQAHRAYLPLMLAYFLEAQP